jgi:hypothetical protein
MTHLEEVLVPLITRREKLKLTLSPISSGRRMGKMNVEGFLRNLLAPTAAALLAIESRAFALDGYYIGNWATNVEACNGSGKQTKLILKETDLLTPELHCKMLGLRQDDKTGTTFMASCSDSNTKWNDEITVKADRFSLKLKLKSEGQNKLFVRCSSEKPQSVR